MKNVLFLLKGCGVDDSVKVRVKNKGSILTHSSYKNRAHCLNNISCVYDYVDVYFDYIVNKKILRIELITEKIF